jgi:cysteine desulfurase
VQERGVRSGTVPAPLVVGFGAAAEVAKQEMAADTAHIRKLAHRLYDGITSQLQGVVLNGPGDLDGSQRYVGNLNLSFAYVEGESLLMGLKVLTLSNLLGFSSTQYRFLSASDPLQSLEGIIRSAHVKVRFKL